MYGYRIYKKLARFYNWGESKSPDPAPSARTHRPPSS